MIASAEGMQQGMQHPMQRVAGGVAGVVVGNNDLILLPFFTHLSIGEADFASQPRPHNDSENCGWGWGRGWEDGGLGGSKISWCGDGKNNSNKKNKNKNSNGNNSNRGDSRMVCFSKNVSWESRNPRGIEP